MRKELATVGYLPDERPVWWKLVLYAIQQVIVMFPATIAVALITGFHISTTIFASGLATLGFILITGKKIPLYYGSSFSYLSAIIGIMAAEFVGERYAGVADAGIRIAQFGIIMSGLVSIAAGFIARRFGRESIEKLLPATITGPVAMVIGLTLATVAINDAIPTAIGHLGAVTVAESDTQLALNLALLVSFVTIMSTIMFSIYLKGFLGQLPLLFGPLVGVLTAFIVKWTTGIDLFRELSQTAGDYLAIAGPVGIPRFTLPIPTWEAVIAIMPIAIATIPESTAHIFQLDVYVNDLARKKKSKKDYKLADMLGMNLIGDGAADMISAAIGGPAGTNYGENISAMAITKVFSVPVLIGACIIAMVIACFTPLISAIFALPQAVIGGIEMFMFGAIAAQGIAILIDRKADMFSAKNIAVIAVIMMIGIGGQFAFGGNIPLFGIEVPCIAGAAIAGIVLNLLLSIGEKKRSEA